MTIIYLPTYHFWNCLFCTDYLQNYWYERTALVINRCDKKCVQKILIYKLVPYFRHHFVFCRHSRWKKPSVLSLQTYFLGPLWIVIKTAPKVYLQIHIFFFLGKCNTATHLSKANKRSSESNETLSVYDGVTVKIEYISTEDDEDSKSEDLASSKELLLSLEERKKVAASVTTIPLRQPLSANYKSSMITSVSDRTNSFNGKYM